MKFVKAIGETQTLKYDSQTTLVVTTEGIVVSDDAANALANRCAVTIEDAPNEGAEVVVPVAVPLPEVAKEVMPPASPETPTPTIKELINEPVIAEPEQVVVAKPKKK